MIEEMLRPLVSERFLNEERYRNGHIRIINALPGVRIMGLHTPEMKNVAKELAGSDAALEIIHRLEREAGKGNTVDEISGNPEYPLCYEEKVIWGFMLNMMKLPVEERLERIAAYVPHIDNWAVCDSFCCSAKWKCPKETIWEFLHRYFASCNEFEVRFAVIMSMCRLMDKDWLPEVFTKFDALDFNVIKSEYISLKQAKKGDVDNLVKGVAIGEPPYYVRMGVAWFLATALAKFPAETRAYAAKSKLPEDVIKLYVRKARESFRTREVSPF